MSQQDRMNCCVCSRQVVKSKVGKEDRYMTNGPVTLMGQGKVCCAECSKDLDEHGRFSEERD